MSDRNPDHLEATTRARFERGRSSYEQSQDRYRIVVTCTWRDPVAQQAAFNCHASDARPGKSYHNPVDAEGKPHSYAIDYQLREISTGKLLEGRTPPEEVEYAIAARHFKRAGFVWSGDWPKREGHVREVGHVNAPIALAHAHAGKVPNWPEVPDD